MVFARRNKAKHSPTTRKYRQNPTATIQDEIRRAWDLGSKLLAQNPTKPPTAHSMGLNKIQGDMRGLQTAEKSQLLRMGKSLACSLAKTMALSVNDANLDAQKIYDEALAVLESYYPSANVKKVLM